MIALIIAHLAIWGRVCGSGQKYLGLAMYPLPYVLVQHNYYAMAFVFAWVFVWKLTGHADGFKDYVRDNFLSRFTAPIAQRLGIDRNSQAYDALFWATKGFLIGIAPAILSGMPLIVLTSALAFPIGYFIGYNVLQGRIYKNGGTWGEWLSGTISGLGFKGCF